MHNVWLIARREYVERVRTRSFLITTLMIPLIMGGFIYCTAYLSSIAVPEAHIARSRKRARVQPNSPNSP